MFDFHFPFFCRYQGDCLQESVLEEAIQNGANSTAFRSLIAWLAAELGILTNLDEEVKYRFI